MRRLSGKCFLCVCVIASFAGCGEQGPAFVPVEGKVVFKQDGSAAQFGTIEFRSESDPPVIARGKIQKDGSFKLKSEGKRGTIEGTHKVVIIQVVSNHRSGGVVHNHGLEVAKKYSNFRTSDLKIEIERETAKQLILEVESK